jgi:DNA-binding transcriptional LysR family regulator
MIPAHINPSLLFALEALLTERNVTRAGRRVGISQSAMSGTLARLRALFKDDLLVPVGRQLVPTPLAEELLHPVRQAIEQIESVFAYRSGFDPTREKRSFIVAASDYATLLLLPRLVARLADDAPGISLRFRYLIPDPITLVAENTVDFVIMPFEMGKHLEGDPLFVDQWVCAVWSKHPSIGRRITKQQYLTLPHATLSISAILDTASIADHHLHEFALKRHISISTESFLLSLFALRRTSAIAIVPRRLAELVKDFAEIKLLKPPFDLPDLRETVFWNRRNDASPSHRWMRSLLIDVARGL